MSGMISAGGKDAVPADSLKKREKSSKRCEKTNV
jgi:hypothetical protein